MSVVKLCLLSLIISLCIYYILSTRKYYTYCTNAKRYSNYMVEEDKQDLYMSLCNSVFKNYSNHTIMRYSIEVFYSIFYSQEPNLEEIKAYILSKRFSTMNYEMKILKQVHFIFYLIILYLLVIDLPKLLIKFIMFFVDKILLVFFIILIFESVLNIFMDFDVDIMKILLFIYSYLPINSIGEVGKFIINKIF